MKIDTGSLRKIAHLARLDIKHGEEESLLASMDSVLSWMDQLNEIDTEGIEPLTHITDEANIWRDDISGNSLTKSEMLENAPAKNANYILVPKVIE